MKAVKIAVIMILVLNGAFSIYKWASKDSSATERLEMTQVIDTVEAAEGLDLASLTVLVKEIRSGQELERRLNENDSINNLDLNGDEKADYINVNEFGDVNNKIGFALSTQPVKDETQEIATVTIEKNVDTAEIQVIGNAQIYGDQAIYNDSAPIERDPASVAQSGEGSGQTHHNYFYPRPLWISPWYFGFYPAFFHPFPIVGRTTYVNRVNNRYQGSRVGRGYNNYQRSSSNRISNPYQGKTANKGITRSLKKPTSTQKQFQATRTKNIRSGGFGQSGSNKSLASSSRSSSTSSKSATSTRSTRSRSFSSILSSGKTSSSRSSSFRSSSFGSRSFSSGK